MPGAPPSSWDHQRTPSAEGNDGRLDPPGGRGSPGPGGPPTKEPGSARRTAPRTRPGLSRVRRRKLQPADRKLRPRPGPRLEPAPPHAAEDPGARKRQSRPRRGPLAAGQEPTPASRAEASLH